MLFFGISAKGHCVNLTRLSATQRVGEKSQNIGNISLILSKVLTVFHIALSILSKIQSGLGEIL